MPDLEGLIARLRMAYLTAERTTMGRFNFSSSVSSGTGDCVCVVVVSRDNQEARHLAAKALSA